MNALDIIVDRAKPKNPKTLNKLLQKQVDFNQTINVHPLHNLKEMPQEWITTRYAIPIIVRIYKENPDFFAGVTENNEKSEVISQTTHLVSGLEGPVNDFQIDIVKEISATIFGVFRHYYYASLVNPKRIILDRIEYNHDNTAHGKYSVKYGQFTVYGKTEPFKFPLLDKTKPNEIFYWSKNIAPETGISVKSVMYTSIQELAKKELATDFWRWLDLSEMPITKDVEVAVMEQYIKEHSIKG